MSKSTILSYVPLNALILNAPEDITLEVSQSGQDFLKTVFSGSDDLDLDDYVHYKHGHPDVVNSWGQKFGMDLNADGDFAMAAILHLMMNWSNAAEEDIVQLNHIDYQAGRHNDIIETDTSGLFNIPVEEDDLTVFVSDKEFDLDFIDNHSFKYGRSVDLTVPLVKLRVNEELTKQFEGTRAIVDKELYSCNSVKFITEFDMSLEGAEVKQAAVMAFVKACAGPIEFRDHIIIDKPFYVYIKVKDRLAFAAYIDIDSFIEK